MHTSENLHAGAIRYKTLGANQDSSCQPIFISWRETPKCADGFVHRASYFEILFRNLRTPSVYPEAGGVCRFMFIMQAVLDPHDSDVHISSADE